MRRVQGSARSGESVSGTRRVPFLRTRRVRSTLAVLVLGLAIVLAGAAAASAAEVRQSSVDRAVTRGLDWLAVHQSRLGHWVGPDGRYPTSMTALAGIALLCEGSTTTQGKYSRNVSKAVQYLVERSRRNGLIGDPASMDDRYTYGHGFSMLFLSQVLGEEEDVERREQLVKVLTKAVIFTGNAQTPTGGWGYVSAKDSGGFDEGSTTITQVQGLRGCRNAGIPVPKEIIDRAVRYIHGCTGADGGVQYNQTTPGGRPPITAAAIACLFNAGDYDDKYVPKLLAYCHRELDDLSKNNNGHWHYSHYYYSQVLYREGGKTWENYRDKVTAHLLQEQNQEGYWDQGFMGPIYTTAMNLTILQLQRGVLPIYQR